MNSTEKGVSEGLLPTTGQIYLLTENSDRSGSLFLLLAAASCPVQEFTDAEALARALREPPTCAGILIHTDMTNPSSELFAAINKLQQDFPSLPPLVFITADSSINSRLTAVRAGGIHFLSEPVEQHALYKVLEKLLTRFEDTHRYKVLLVDDDPDQLLYYKAALQDARLILQTLSQPLDILHTLDYFQADVIVIRQRMSACSGFELGQVIRQAQPAISPPLVYLYDQADEILHMDVSKSDRETFLSLSLRPEFLIEPILAKAQRIQIERQLDQQLQDSLNRSELYHYAMDQHNIISITDIRGRITEVNDRFCAISSYQREELIGQTHRLIKSDRHDNAFYTNLWQTIRAGKVWRGEICNLRKNGQEYWVSSTIVPFLDRRGKPWQYVSVRTDITALHASQDRLNRAQNFAHISNWEWNPNTDELRLSEQMGPLFGRPAGITVTSLEEFKVVIHPDDVHLVLEAIDRCLDENQDFDIEHRTLWPDGSIHWVHESGDVLRNVKGEPVVMLGVVRDISGRKAIELGLKEERRRLREAQKIGAIGDWWLNFSEDSIHCSPEVLRIAGLKTSEPQIAPKQLLDKVHPDDRKAIGEDGFFVLHQGHSKVDFRIYPDKDTLRWVQMVRHANQDHTGRVTGFRGTVQDITELKEAELQHQHNNRILESIAKDAPLQQTLSLLIERAEALQPGKFGAVFATDLAKGHLYCSAAPSLPKSLTATLDELTINLNHYPQPETDLNNIPSWQNFKAVGEKLGFYLCSTKGIPSSSGQFLGLLLMYSHSPDTHSNERPFFSTELARFATIAIEQKQVLWSLIEAKEEADNANQAKSQFLSHISHDLRTPLTAIMGFGQLLSMDPSSPLNQRQQESVTEINKASEHLLDLINDILNLVQIESGHIELKMEAINVAELVGECESLIAPLAQERDIHFTTAQNEKVTPTTEPFFVAADRKRLKQILLNLLSNAVKYNRHGGSITVNYQPKGKNLRILVTDTGGGLTQVQQKRLFSAFERLEAEETNTKGSGIGLVVAKGLVENMAGTIGIESEPGTGSTFWIELPRQLSTPLLEAPRFIK